MFLRIDHVGLVVEGTAAAGASLELLAMTRFDGGIAPGYQVDCQFWRCRNDPRGPAIELVAPLDPAATVRGYLDRHGPGLHHLAFEVDDLAADLRALRSSGAVPLDPTPRDGARAGMQVAFAYLGLTTGLLVELVQYHPTRHAPS